MEVQINNIVELLKSINDSNNTLNDIYNLLLKISNDLNLICTVVRYTFIIAIIVFTLYIVYYVFGKIFFGGV